MSSNKGILLAVTISMVFSVIYILTNRSPEIFIFGKEVMDFIYTLAISTIAASIFYLIQVYIPEKRRLNILKSNFVLNYSLFKQDCIDIFLSCINEHPSSKLLKKLSNPDDFKIYFKENFVPGQNRWHGVINKLQSNGIMTKKLLLQFEILSSEIDFFLHNVALDNKETFAFLKRFKIAIHSLKNTSNEYDEVESLSDFMWQLFAGWSFTEGYRKNDIFEEMVERL